MGVVNVNLDELPREEAEPVVQLLDLDPKALVAHGFKLHRVEDPDMGPSEFAAVKVLGSTAIIQHYDWNPEPGFTVSFFPPVPKRARVHEWLVSQLRPASLDMLWLYEGGEDPEMWRDTSRAV